MRKPKATEHEIQAAIVDALRLAGLTVYETTAYRQKGPSGVDKGIPDLLVCSDQLPWTYLGIEVKRPGCENKFSSSEQERACSERRFVVATSPEEALGHAAYWLQAVSISDTIESINRVLRALKEAA